MICKSVSRHEIRAMKIGQTSIFTLPDYKAIETARVQFSIMKRREAMDFERVTMDELRNVLGNDFESVVPDESMTIAYRRLA